MSEESPSAATLLRRGGRPLAALLLVGLVFKLLVLAAALDGDPLTHHATSDVAYYLDRARELEAGAQLPAPHQMPPLYPRLLALLPGATSDPSTSVLLLQVLAGTAGLALAWLAAARRTDPRTALWAPLLCLAYGPLSFFETKRLGDALATVLLLAVVVVAETLPRARRARDEHDHRPAAREHRATAPRDAPVRDAVGRAALLRGAAAGALAALAALLRPQALLLLPLLALWAWRASAARAAVALLVAAALVLLPSTLHNLRGGAGLVPVSANGPINLWLAHAGPPSGTFVTDRPEFGNLHDQARVSRRFAEQERGRPLAWSEVSAYWRAEALAEILDDPLDALRRVGLRAAALVESFQTGIVTVPQVERRLVPPLRLAALPFGVLLGLAAGVWVAAGRRPARADAAARARRAGAPDALPAADAPPRPPGPSALPAWLLAASVVVSTLLFFHYERFRLPLVPLLAVAVAVGLGRLRARRPTPARVAAAALVALLLTAQGALPRSHHPHVRANGWTSVAEARLAQLHPGDRAGLERAERELARALDADPRFPRALLGHARVALLRGDRAAAAERLARAEALVPGWDALAELRARLDR